jgi:hypothetical protein
MAMQIEKRYLERIKKAQVDHAIAAVKTPQDKSAYGFGVVCGTAIGLLLAEQLFEEVIGEDHGRN